MKKIISSMVSLVSALCILGLSVFPAFAAVTESEDNNSYQTADNISFDETVKGKISETADADYYKISVNKKGYLSIEFNNPLIADESCRWSVTVFKAGVSIDEISSHAVPATVTSTVLPKIGVEEGVYYIKIADGNFGWGKVDNVGYSFTVTHKETDYWESEFNNKYTIADRIVTDKQYGGFLRDTGDADYYELNIEKSGYIKIGFKNDVSTDTSATWRIEVFRLEDELKNIHNQLISATKEESSLPKIGVEKGTYYICVSDGNYGWGHLDGFEYSFIADFTATNYWESELNDEYTLSDNIVTDKQYGGFLRSTSDSDYYKFNVSKNGYIKINFENTLSTNTSAKWNFKVLRLENELKAIHEQTVQATQTKTEFTEIGVEKGTYYICISDGNYGWGHVDNIEYRFTVDFVATEYWEYEFNNEYIRANPIKTDAVYSGNISKAYGSDYYSFSINKAADIQIVFNNLKLNDINAKWNIELFKDGDSLERIFSSSAGATKKETVFSDIRLSPGKYYICISNGNGGYENVKFATYSFSVKTEKNTLLGDVNLDGKVTASDARFVLRASVKLEDLSATQLNVADVDGKAGITAADARLILRASVGLEKL